MSLLTIERRVRIIAIRNIASKLVGPCTDLQITTVAVHARIIGSSVKDLELLSDLDVDNLWWWLREHP